VEVCCSCIRTCVFGSPLAMVAIDTVADASRPREIIEQTFNVFCNHCVSMDIVSFVKFCGSCKRVCESDASAIFFAVVRNVHDGMDLDEFKDALSLLVNVQKGNSADRKTQGGKSSKVGRPADQTAIGRKLAAENRGPNTTVSRMPSSSFSLRWSPPCIDQ